MPQTTVFDHPSNHLDNPKPTTSHVRGASCLLRLLLSKSAFLIWVLRCGRVVQEETMPQNPLQRALCNNIRLANDKIIASKIKQRKGFTSLMVNTWSMYHPKKDTSRTTEPECVRF